MEISNPEGDRLIREHPIFRDYIASGGLLRYGETDCVRRQMGARSNRGNRSPERLQEKLMTQIQAEKGVSYVIESCSKQ